MVWPTANDFFDAVQHPLRHFSKPELKRSQVALDDRGKPRVLEGKRQDIYELRDANGQERWAIGCFASEPRGQAHRIQLINDHLDQRPLTALVPTEFVHQGIVVRGRWHPITRSRWVDGLPLNEYVRQYLDHPDELRLLADAWQRLARDLRQAGMAHGNLAADTVLVTSGLGGALTLRLVDYDGIFVPALAKSSPEEMGQEDFQHWQRSEQRSYDADIDRFSQMVILTALYALAHEGRQLWDECNNGGNLLFCASDFKVPALSPLLKQLWRSESSKVRALTGNLILACHQPINEVPDLETMARCLRPGAAKSAMSARQIEQIEQVLDIQHQLGDLELVGPEVRPTANASMASEVITEPTAMAQAIKAGPPPAPKTTPPPLPVMLDHPLMHTYQLDAWMPEQVALVKLFGFVKELRGKVVRNIPGYLRVQIKDEQDQVEANQPGLLSMMGLRQRPPREPRTLAVIELNLVPKPTPTKQLVGITLRLTPGEANAESPRWKSYCDRVFCDLRGYLMGFV